MNICGNPDVYFIFDIVYVNLFTVYSDMIFLKIHTKFINRTKIYAKSES